MLVCTLDGCVVEVERYFVLIVGYRIKGCVCVCLHVCVCSSHEYVCERRRTEREKDARVL